MAFSQSDLFVVNTNGEQTVYAYNTADTITSITTDNTYFGATHDGTDGLMRAGDIILAVGDTGSTYEPAMLCVEAVSTGEVTTRALAI